MRGDYNPESESCHCQTIVLPEELHGGVIKHGESHVKGCRGRERHWMISKKATNVVLIP